MASLKKRLILIREELGLSQSKMSKKLEIPLRTYQRLEQEDVDIKSSIIEKYASIGVNIEWLVTGNGEMYGSIANENQPHRKIWI